ncbi:MAG: Maf family protein [Thermoplasmatota archaeon]
MSLVLASASPRRAALLAQLGLAFTVSPAKIDETPRVGEAADALVERLAREKAAAVEGEFVLGADTDVVLDGRIFGQPGDARAAREMLAALAGRTHEVHSAVAIATARGARVFTGVEVARVTMRPLSPRAIDAYAATGEPLGKAGGYAIQGAGAAFVARVEGDPSCVIGLPLGLTLRLLAEAGYSLPAHLRVP